MITFSMSGGEPQIEMAMRRPAVYLDHWAWRRFAEDEEYTDRLCAAIGSLDGTLCVSWLNVAEFSKMQFGAAAREAEALLEQIIPRVFLLESNPWKVIETEDQKLTGEASGPPHGDFEFLQVLESIAPESLQPVSAKNVFQAGQEAGKELLQRMAGLYVKKVTDLRNKCWSEDKFAQAVSRVPKGSSLPAATRFILSEVLKPLIKDKRVTISSNDAMDFYHTVVPVAYCDYVLLDGRWASFANQARARLKKAGHHCDIARTFSGKGTGLEGFFHALESFS